MTSTSDAIEQQAYEGLGAARRANGLARIAMGVHLHTLQESGGWRGRTGAQSFRRFLIEEGLEPRAAFQYMTVARAFVVEHGVEPTRIAGVGMRVLTDAAKHLTADNVNDVVELVENLPAAEALDLIRQRYEHSAVAEDVRTAAKTSTPVSAILHSVEGLTFDGRAELYRALKLTVDPTAQARHHVTRLIRRPVIMAPEPPPESYLHDLP